MFTHFYDGLVDDLFNDGFAEAFNLALLILGEIQGVYELLISLLAYLLSLIS